LEGTCQPTKPFWQNVQYPFFDINKGGPLLQEEKYNPQLQTPWENKEK